MRIFGIVTFGILVALCGFFLWHEEAYAPIVSPAIHKETDVSITLEADMDREAIAAHIGEEFGFDEAKIRQFHNTYRVMQWDAFNETLITHLTEKYELPPEDVEILVTHATIYLNQERDILEPLYIPGRYVFPRDASVVEVVTELLQPLVAEPMKITEQLALSDEAILMGYLKSTYELLPDLVPLPPLDVALREEGGRTLLVFTTVYYNKGLGPLELRADPETIGIIGDFDRDVAQRIYRKDGTYRERPSGTFEWHHEHIHYHFVDFVEYLLEGIDNEYVIGDDGLLQKSTFCIRDVSRVSFDGLLASTSAEYLVCGRERQGVSVGWGDAYFNTYVDQNLDITELPSGMYRLSFYANPEDRFDEVTKENNRAHAIIKYDKEAMTVEVLSVEPAVLPEFEHIHIKQTLS